MAQGASGKQRCYAASQGQTADVPLTGEGYLRSTLPDKP